MYLEDQIRLWIVIVVTTSKNEANESDQHRYQDIAQNETPSLLHTHVCLAGWLMMFYHDKAVFTNINLHSLKLFTVIIMTIIVDKISF